MAKKSKIEIFKELYEANFELGKDIKSMIDDLELNKINSLSGILRKLICDNTRDNHPLLLDLIGQEKYPITFYALFDDLDIDKCVLSIPFGNGETPSVSLIKIDFSQKVEINDWLDKVVLKKLYKYKKGDNEIEKINYTPKDIILLYANKKGVHSDIKIDKELESLEELKISNDYFSNIERFKKFLFDIGSVLNVKITEFIEYFEIQNKGNQELIDFYNHKIENISKKINLNNTNPEFYYERAIFYYKLNDFDNSLKDINSCLNLIPNLKKGLFQKSILFHHQKKYKEAIEIYNEIIRNGYGEPVIFNNLGNVYQDNGDFDLAIESYNKALELNNNYVLSIYGKGKTYRLKGDFQEAIDTLNRIVSLNFQPNISEELGLTYMKNKEYDNAIKYFKNAISYHPNEKSYYLYIGICLNEKQEYKKAIEYYNKALDIDENCLLAYYNKGNSNLKYGEYHLNNGRNEKSIKYFEEALICYDKVSELNPNYELLHTNQAFILYRLGYDFDTIMEVINEGIKLYPQKESNYISKLFFLKEFLLEDEFRKFKSICLEYFKGNKIVLEKIEKLTNT